MQIRKLSEPRKLKIALLYNTDYYLWKFRSALIQRLLNEGHQVFAVCPLGEHVHHLQKMGTVHIPVKLDKQGMNPLKDIAFLIQLVNIYREHRFDIVHTFTIKPNIFGALAGGLSGGSIIISSIVGLGFTFSSDNGLSRRMLIKVVEILYKIAFRFSSYVIFQNQDDLDLFVQKGLLKPEQAVLIRSSGIDLDEYSPSAVSSPVIEKHRKELDIPSHAIVVTLVSRMLWEKGIKEYIEAAKAIRNTAPDTVFLLVGGLELDYPSAVDEGTLLNAFKDRSVQWLGHRDDIKEILALTDIFVLPSFYREGVPRSIIEAMAMGKPVVTTNSVGCKETVEEGKNGFLIPPNNIEALTKKILCLLNDSALRSRMGNYSRVKAQAEFNVLEITDRIISLYDRTIARRICL